MEFCPTGDMIGDLVTKPTQGEMFKRLREYFMGVTEAQDTGTRKSKIS